MPARTLDSSQVTTAGELTLDAENTSGIDATILSATSSGAGAFSIVLAFNSIGWKSENVLFSTIDALIGDLALATAFNGAQPSISQAYISGSTVKAGAVSLSADDATQLNATVSNAADSTASALYGAAGKSAGCARGDEQDHQCLQLAYISGGSVNADELGISAKDEAGVFADVKMVSSSITTNDGGARVLQDEINNFQPADFLSSEGTRYRSASARRSRLASRRHRLGGSNGSVYEWMGPDGTSINLSDPTATNPGYDYTNLGWWKPVPATQLIPQGNNFAPPGRRTRRRSVASSCSTTSVAPSTPSILNATVTVGGGIDLSADEKATIEATADSSATSSGGSSFNGKGDSNAIDGVISTNVVLASANADITGLDGHDHRHRQRRPRRRQRVGDHRRHRERDDLRRQVRRRADRVQHDRLGVLEPTVQRARRARSASTRPRSTTGVRPSTPGTFNPDDRVKTPDGNVYRYLGATVSSPNLSNTERAVRSRPAGSSSRRPSAPSRLPKRGPTSRTRRSPRRVT